ncbi:MAG TPA: MBL fold metallo-hydrolase [Vicinamibacterales bacterium]|nr:MBL fold metallo-hydrolase [Vicinamibacterales bacterium]
MRRVLLAVTVILAAGPGSGLAQVRTAYPEKRGLALDQFPRTIKLAENVYGYEDIRQPGFTTVTLFVVGANGVLIADGQGSPAATQKLLDAIKAVTPKPVRWYVVGSDHGDHTAGNSVLPKDITYIIHPNSLAQMQRDAANPNRQPNAPPVIVPPAAMSGASQTIDVDGIEVRAIFLGRAHTGGDLMVYLPRQKILFMSEAYLNRVFPAMRSAYPSEWVATIDKALAMDVDRYVPGHGFIEEPRVSREELVEFQKALKAVNAEVKRLHDQGLSADAAIAQASWGPYSDWFLRDQQAPIAVRKVYEELDGKLK